MSKLTKLIEEHEGFRDQPYWDKTGQEMWQGLQHAILPDTRQPLKENLGPLTIGYGFNLEAPRSSEFWEYVLEWDVRGAFIEASKYSWFGPLCGWSEDGHQYRDHVIEYDFSPLNARQAVIVSMIYQLGPRGFAGFERFMNNIDYAVCSGSLKQTLTDPQHFFDRAAEEMLDSKWAMQTPGRAHGLAEMMRTGEW